LTLLDYNLPMFKLNDQSINYDDKILFPIPIEIALSHLDLIDFDFYIVKNTEKFFKIRPGVEAIEEMLQRYKKNKISELYIENVHYKKFLKSIKTRLSNKLFDPSTITLESEKVLSLNEAYTIVGTSLKKFGVNENIVDFIKDVNKQSISLMKDTPNIFLLFKEYKKKCKEGFLRSILTSFTASLIIRNYVWNNDKTMTSISQASLLSEIILSNDELKLISDYEGNFDQLPKSIKNYPFATAELLKDDDSFANEIIDCIEQHCELPNGKGFPRQLSHSRIGQMPAILIIARFFANELIKVKFDFTKKDEIISKLEDNFDYPVFKKHLSILLDVINN